MNRDRSKATSFSSDNDLHCLTQKELENSPLHCVLVDEAQFLSRDKSQLCKIVDEFNIPVLAYGIRTDFQGELFEGSKCLLAWADNLVEIKTICTAVESHHGCATRLEMQLPRASRLKLAVTNAISYVKTLPRNAPSN